jgi:hypothetical protein
MATATGSLMPMTIGMVVATTRYLR